LVSNRVDDLRRGFACNRSVAFFANRIPAPIKTISALALGEAVEASLLAGVAS
jgi:hypothetical protein